MTLNDLERRNSLFCAFLPNSIDLLANYVTVVEDRPTLCLKNILDVFSCNSRKHCRIFIILGNNY